MPCRFVHVSGPDIPNQVKGIYCEACVAAANVLAERKKAQRELLS